MALDKISVVLVVSVAIAVLLAGLFIMRKLGVAICDLADNGNICR